MSNCPMSTMSISTMSIFTMSISTMSMSTMPSPLHNQHLPISQSQAQYLTLIISPPYHHHLTITISPSPSFYLTITISPSHTIYLTISPSPPCHHFLPITITLSQSCHHNLTMTISPSHLHPFGVTISLSHLLTILPSLSHQFTILLSPSLRRGGRWTSLDTSFAQCFTIFWNIFKKSHRQKWKKHHSKNCIVKSMKCDVFNDVWGFRMDTYSFRNSRFQQANFGPFWKICSTRPQNVLLINLCHRSPEPSEIH